VSYLLGLGAVVLLALLGTLLWVVVRVRASIPLHRVVVESLFVGYMTAVLAVAFVPFGRVSGDGTPASVNLVPFATILWLARGLPGQVLRQLGGNVVMFVPFGLLAPMLSERMRRPLALAAAALAVSLGIEVVQSALQLMSLSHRSFDVDDVMLNVAGALVGYGAWWAVGRLSNNGINLTARR